MFNREALTQTGKELLSREAEKTVMAGQPTLKDIWDMLGRTEEIAATTGLSGEDAWQALHDGLSRGETQLDKEPKDPDYELTTIINEIKG